MSFSLIVLTSFYEAAHQAVPYADALASTLGGRLVLLHVNRVSAFDPYVFVDEAWRRQELGRGADTMALLTRLAGQLKSPATVEQATDLVPDVARALAARHAPALFVLGRPDPALELLRAAQLPVLLVPIGTPVPALPLRVLVAADREDFALTGSAAGAQELLRALGAVVTVAYASEVEDDEGAAAALRAVRRSGLAAGLPEPDLRGYQYERPADGVLAAIADTRADLVVVLARPRSYLGELFHRSVTAAVASRSPVPVLVVPVAEVPAPQPVPVREPVDTSWLWPGV